MCLLFVSDPGVKKVPYEKFQNAWNQNSDGFGMMWADKGRVVVSKTQLSAQKAWQMYQRAPTDRTVIGHFRWGTSGLKDIHNTHPFPVDNNRKIWLAHNGVFNQMTLDKPNMSDTWHFARLIGGLFPTWEQLEDSENQKLINESIGPGNKVAFLNNQGHCLIFGHEQGTTIDGVWYSNTYSLTSRQYGGYYRSWKGGWHDGDDSEVDGYGWAHGYSGSKSKWTREDAKAEAQADACAIGGNSRAITEQTSMFADSDIRSKNTGDGLIPVLGGLLAPAGKQSKFSLVSDKTTITDLANMSRLDMINFTKLYPHRAADLLYSLCQE